MVPVQISNVCAILLGSVANSSRSSDKIASISLSLSHNSVLHHSASSVDDLDKLRQGATIIFGDVVKQLHHRKVGAISQPQH